MVEIPKEKQECLIVFHAEFIKDTGPMGTGQTRVVFDVPELFDEELNGIRTILRGKCLKIYIFEDDLDKGK